MRTLNAVKLRNRIRNINPALDTRLKNVRINGVLQGCSGFVHNPDNGRTVYVSTDRNHGIVTQAMYRYAENMRDFAGGVNRFCEYDADILAGEVVTYVSR